MFLSSTGFSMNIHYCQDQLQGISFISKDKCCSDKNIKSTCHKTKNNCHHDTAETEKTDLDNCCHNEKLVIDKSDVDAITPQLGNIQDINIEVINTFVATSVFNYRLKADVQTDAQYKPPLSDRDIQVLYQSFLI